MTPEGADRGDLPGRAQRVTVFGFTRKIAATSEGVSN